MRNTDMPEFNKLLGDFLMGYGKPRPDADTTAFWFKTLLPFSPATIGQAFNVYAAERPDFAPAPNGIAARCRLLDGRPDENEAWALALASQDERETVMWTEEMQEAFSLCRPVLAGGDEVGARMAFKDAYTRLVSAARAADRPASWKVSEGWDRERRELVIARAVRTELLGGPPAHLSLTVDGDVPAEKPEGLQRVLEAVAKLEDPRTKAARIQAENEEADRKRREAIDRQTREYLEKHPEARYGQLDKMKPGAP
jgi:hypothetical protein